MSSAFRWTSSLDAWRVSLHGLLLFALFVTFRLNAMTLLSLPWSGSAMAAIVPTIGFLSAFEAGWLLLGRLLSRWPATFLTLFWVAHLFLGALELVLEQFYLLASEHITPAYLWFTVAHPPEGALHFALGTADHLFVGRVLAYVAGLIVISVLLRLDVCSVRRLPSWGLAFVVLGGTVLVRLPAIVEDASHPDAGNLLLDFASSIDLHPARGDAIRTDIAGYARPRVLGTGAAAGAPNFLVFILESTRAELIGPDPEHTGMPFVSQLLKEGVVFTNGYAGVTHTSKALSVIHCGMYPRLTSTIDEATPGDHALRCLPDLLGKAGYATSFWQSAYASFEHRTDLARNLGFQETTAAEALPGQWGKAGLLGIDEQALVEPMTKWMVSHRDHPFFVSALTVSTHFPYQPPGMARPTTRGERKIGYRAAALNADTFVHRVVSGLQEAGLLDNTVILIVGDHGEGFAGDHPGYGGHDRSPFEEVTHVPLGMYGPRWLGPARVDTELRHQIDILPTILDLAGVAWAGTVPGLDLLTSSGHPTVFTSCFQPKECLMSRTGNFATIYEYGMHATRVYDLRNDPGETHDLAAFQAPADLDAGERVLLSFAQSVDHYYATRKVTETTWITSLIRERTPMPEPPEE